MSVAFAHASLERLKAVDVILTDIDDTLTTEGVLEADAYRALEDLRAAGFTVIPVTGRPAGWCDMIARFFPVDAVVGENGAFAFMYDREARRMRRFYARSADDRVHARQSLAELADVILTEVPGARISADQPYREADLAVDFAEDVGPLPDGDIEKIVSIFEEAGATAKVSSIHVNGWFGTYSKLEMTERLLEESFGIAVSSDADRARVLFIGDSPNDAPMFGFFENSVAVANFARFSDRVQQQPTWLTSGYGGAGFVEMAKALISARGNR